MDQEPTELGACGFFSWLGTPGCRIPRGFERWIRRLVDSLERANPSATREKRVVDFICVIILEVPNNLYLYAIVLHVEPL